MDKQDSTKYKNVNIIWDEDHDERIYTFVNSLSDEEREELSWANERKGSLMLGWKRKIPERFKELVGVEVEGDFWGIYEQTIEHSNITEEIIEIARIVSIEDRYKILKRQKWRCNFCNTRLKFSQNSDWNGEIAHIDHIHPYSKRFNYQNGIESINETENLQALCPKCNLKKGKKEVN